MNELVPIALIGWIPLALLVVGFLGVRTGIFAVFILGWLFLPVSGFEIRGLPDYDKVFATSAAALLAAVVYDGGRLARLRPRWFDLPIIAWCICPLASSLANGLGAYDGLAAVFGRCVGWGVPYLLGRVYVHDRASLTKLSAWIVLGGLLYVPLCLFEVRMSPQLHTWLYGFHQHSFAQTIRYGGFRPTVFLQHGLAVALWMVWASLIAIWLWWRGGARRLWGISAGWAALALLCTAVLCKSAGALLLLAAGLAALTASRWLRTGVPLLCLLLVPPVYAAARMTAVWDPGSTVRLFATVMGEDRAQSFAFRLQNEEILIDRARQRPLVGWGGWGRGRVHDPDTGRDVSITDGLWIITLGQNGIVGFGALFGALLLPAFLLVSRRRPGSWDSSGGAAQSALAVLCVLFAIDSLMNAMPNPVFILTVGGLTGFAGSQRQRQGARQPVPTSLDPSPSRDGLVPVEPWGTGERFLYDS